ncbi:MAG: succinate dehydrogenase, hydrophobic membrane anchor protein [Methylococcales bacterium]
MDFKSTLSKLCGANPTVHWLLQRITALLLIPLSYWLIVLLKLTFTAPYQTTIDWLTSPLNTLALGAWVAAVFYHAALGLQVVIEDYVPQQPIQTLSIRAVNIVFGILALVALAALFNIFSQGNP